MKPLRGLTITDIERIVLDVPFTPRCQQWNAREIWQWRISEILRVTTSDPDIVGYGETLLHYTWSRVPEQAIERARGANPATLLGDDTLGPGLQMALYDIVGQALGVPIYRLLPLPRVREWCPISWWNIDMPPHALAAEAQDALAKGYTAYKIKARPWWDLFEQIHAIASVTPPAFRLDIDWNQMLLTPGNAAPVLAELDREPRVAIYESPILQRDLQGLRHLRQKTTRPIALHFGEPPFPTVALHDACDGFVISGGVSSILQQATLAAAFEKTCWLQMVGTGITTAFCLHLAAVLPAAQWPAVNCLNNYADDLLTTPIEIVGGYARVPEAPGIGVQIDLEALQRYRIAPPFEIPQPRLLLSVLWPGGRVMHYASMQQCWNDFLAGNQPVQERGVTMQVHPDDGSPEWEQLYARARIAPVRDRQ
ncbi:MAG: mandelate racemase/muconate lactonizing enzyme family protein [Chloroherpetonaceae bacterium]|nr:mandelate racemase/muconate lactonizing enzyme family protein [Chloroherpetonaceae bacterium]